MIELIEAVQGDITRIPVDAIVNAANRELAGGGGVDGAIWRAAGHDDMMRACNAIGGCEVGHAVATPAFNLPAKWVIHTVGPVWAGGSYMRSKHEWRHALVRDLTSCYNSSCYEAMRLGAESISFPAISTGVFRFPPELAAHTAVETLCNWTGQLKRAVLVAYDAMTLSFYHKELNAREA